MITFNPTEKYQSQIPAMQLLVNLGFEPLAQEKVFSLRGQKLSQLLLTEILEKRLLNFNQFMVKGQSYPFTIEDAQLAIQALQPSPDQLKGLRRTNQEIYDLLMLGTAVRKTIDGDSKSYTMRYIDWQNPENNRYHMAAEFSVERTSGRETRRCDIVGFVNGIPFIVIENKSPHIPLKKAENQLIDYQSEDNIPQLFHYAQLLLTMNRQEAKYATVGSSVKYWHFWRDSRDEDHTILKLINKSLNKKQKQAIFSGDLLEALPYFDNMEKSTRLVTAQDRLIYALCRPARLLDLIRRFTVFDHGDRKIARHQQYFAILKTLQRVTQTETSRPHSTLEIDTRHAELKVAETVKPYIIKGKFDDKSSPAQKRQGGIIWHTQGSGKSLTMVMLARALVLEPSIKNPRIILVTDRKDLDKQIRDTFRSCELEPVQAKSGNKLLQLIADHKPLITTIVNKFKNSKQNQSDIDTDPNLFILVDESHRTQSGKYGGHGTFALAMRERLPNACYIGFTGTPLLKRERNTLTQYGGLIHQYTIRDAVDDQAVVPLLYEGRLVEQKLSNDVIDQWFEKISDGLTNEQKADLKRKFTRLNKVNNTQQTLQAKAYDISEHYRRYWQGTGFKAQLVAPSKAAAITFKEILDDIGHVSSEVIISSPNEKEGKDDIDSESKDKVVRFWKQMMQRYGSEDRYNDQIIERFKDDSDAEILIVVNKLLTGFDAPRNTILYLCRSLREHNLLQAIARVNRLFEENSKSKEFGIIIDYEGLLGELDQALTTYSSLDGYGEQELVGTVHDIREQIQLLSHYHEQLWDIFKSVANKQDMESLEQYLDKIEIREIFYEQLRVYGRTLHIALSSEKALDVFNTQQIERFRNDLKYFMKLKHNVQKRYQEIVDIKDYEPKIQKLLDNHVIAEPARKIIDAVNINDPNALQHVIEEEGISQASKADRIASATQRTITENMALDPAFYRRFSELLAETIAQYRARRLSETAYLKQVTDIASKVANKEHDIKIPEKIQSNDNAISIYGILLPILIPLASHNPETKIADISHHIVDIINQHRIVNMWSNDAVIKTIQNKIDDYFFDVVAKQLGSTVSTEILDDIQKQVLYTAKARFSE
jgi:type I restriction enzyme R subunit